MSINITVGEFLFEVNAHFTKVTEYGVSLEALLGGQEAPPPEGARFDVAFEGAVQGSKLKGEIAGIDYLHIRADGRAQLHIHGLISADDDVRISYSAEGVSAPEEDTGLLQVRENATMITSFPTYAWVNQLAVWIQGVVNPATGEINLKGYAA